MREGKREESEREREGGGRWNQREKMEAEAANTILHNQ